MYAIWTQVLGHLTITPIGTLMTLHSKYKDIDMELDLLCSNNSSTEKAFQQECFCGNYCTFIQWSTCELRHWCWTRRSGSQSPFQYIPKVLRSEICAGQSSSSTPNTVAVFTPLYPTFGIVLGDVRLACSCSAIENADCVAWCFILCYVPDKSKF